MLDILPRKMSKLCWSKKSETLFLPIPYYILSSGEYYLKVPEFLKYISSKGDPFDYIMEEFENNLLYKSDDADCDNLFCQLLQGIFNREAFH